MDSPQAQVTVVGVAGGVGTTTVTALLWLALCRHMPRPALLDHAGGDLSARLPQAATQPGSGIVLGDAGVRSLAEPLASAAIVIVGPHTERGLELMRQRIANEQSGVPLLRVTCAVYGTRRAGLYVPMAPNPAGPPLRIGFDQALRAPGPVNPAELAPATWQAAAVLAELTIRAGLQPSVPTVNW